jgi:DNA-binding NarL/FixJ family response regulator
LEAQLFLIDDHPIVRESLHILIAQRFDQTVVRSFSSIDEFGNWCVANPTGFHARDIALLDLGLPGFIGTEAVNTFVQRWPDFRVIVFSGQATPTIVRAVAQAGAKGFISKNTDMNVFIKAIDLILAGGEFFPADVLRQEPFATSQLNGSGSEVKRPTAIHPAAQGLLSDRQQSVLALLGSGASNKQIARELTMSESTVKNTVTAIMRLFGTGNRTQTAQAARDRGLI